MKRASKPFVGSRIVGRLKGFVAAIEKGDPLTKRFTFRAMRLNLKPQVYNAALVKETRGKLSASQAVFAKFLGVSLSTVRDWEQGLKTPKPIACRLMDEIRRDPDYWLKRLKELATSTIVK